MDNSPICSVSLVRSERQVLILEVRGSNPLRCTIAPLAQTVEQGSFKPKVVGSIPTGRTMKISEVMQKLFDIYQELGNVEVYIGSHYTDLPIQGVELNKDHPIPYPLLYNEDLH